MPAGAPVKDSPALDSRSAGISGSLADTGPGGSGKTRLAIEAAVELVPDQTGAVSQQQGASIGRVKAGTSGSTVLRMSAGVSAASSAPQLPQKAEAVRILPAQEGQTVTGRV